MICPDCKTENGDNQYCWKCKKEINSKSGLYSKFIDLFKREEPYKYEKIYKIGTLEYSKGNYKEALEHFKRALILNPEDKKMYLKIALSYEKLNKVDRAIDMYKRYIENVPDNKLKGKAQKRLDKLIEFTNKTNSENLEIKDRATINAVKITNIFQKIKNKIAFMAIDNLIKDLILLKNNWHRIILAILISILIYNSFFRYEYLVLTWSSNDSIFGHGSYSSYSSVVRIDKLLNKVEKIKTNSK